MGHHAGYIALNVGIATGALAVLLPERPFDFERDILERMRQTQATGKKHFIIIVSEGVISAQDLANQIQAATGVDSRATVLGHIQRGGSPTVRDRVNASLMGYHAIDLLDRGIYNRVVAVSGGKIVRLRRQRRPLDAQNHRRLRNRGCKLDFDLKFAPKSAKRQKTLAKQRDVWYSISAIHTHCVVFLCPKAGILPLKG